MKLQKLNLGCGKDIKAGYINLDCIKLPGVDVVHDLNKFPWPFNDNEFEEIYCAQILEHLSDLIKVVEELWRISKKGAILRLSVPYYHSQGAFRDPTHKLFFHYYTFDYFLKNEKLNYYSNIRFSILYKKTITFVKFLNIIPDIRIPFYNITFRVLLSYFIPNLISELYFILRVEK